MNLDGLIYRLHFIEISKELICSRKFLAFFIITQRLKELYNLKITKASGVKELFSKTILYNLIDSNLGYIGCMQAGAFYASFHHLRFGIELYASCEYCFEKKDSVEPKLLRYIFYPEIETLKIKKKNGSTEKANASSETILKIFNVNESTIESVKYWHLEKNNQKLINKIDEIHKINHQNSCHYTHLSSFRFRSELPRIGFPSYWENNCMQSLCYSWMVCVSLIKNDCLKKEMEYEVNKIFNSVFKDISSMELFQIEEMLEINKNYIDQVDNDRMKILEQDKLFYRFETLVGKFHLLFEDGKINFTVGGKGVFTKDILLKVLDESAGFLGSLKAGSFSSSLTHLRSLIELSAIFNYCSKNKDHFEKMIGRYMSFKEIEIHKRIQEQTNGLKNWGISQEFIDKNHKPVDLILREKFSKSIKEIEKIKSWAGGLTIADFFSSFDSSTHTQSYDLLSLRTHPYSVRCEDYVGDITQNEWGQFLTRAVHYCCNICTSILEMDLLEEPSAIELKSLWIDIAQVLLPRIKTIQENQQS